MERRQSSSQSPETINLQLQITQTKDGVECVYVKLKDDKVKKSLVVGEKCSAVLDLNNKNEVVGIEMLEPGHLRVFQEFRKIAKKYHVRGLEHVNIGRLQEAFV